MGTTRHSSHTQGLASLDISGLAMSSIRFLLLSALVACAVTTAHGCACEDDPEDLTYREMEDGEFYGKGDEETELDALDAPCVEGQGDGHDCTNYGSTEAAEAACKEAGEDKCAGYIVYKCKIDDVEMYWETRAPFDEEGDDDDDDDDLDDDDDEIDDDDDDLDDDDD